MENGNLRWMEKFQEVRRLWNVRNFELGFNLRTARRRELLTKETRKVLYKFIGAYPIIPRKCISLSPFLSEFLLFSLTLSFPLFLSLFYLNLHLPLLLFTVILSIFFSLFSLLLAFLVLFIFPSFLIRSFSTMFVFLHHIRSLVGL